MISFNTVFVSSELCIMFCLQFLLMGSICEALRIKVNAVTMFRSISLLVSILMKVQLIPTYYVQGSRQNKNFETWDPFSASFLVLSMLKSLDMFRFI